MRLNSQYHRSARVKLQIRPRNAAENTPNIGESKNMKLHLRYGVSMLCSVCWPWYSTCFNTRSSTYRVRFCSYVLISFCNGCEKLVFETCVEVHVCSRAWLTTSWRIRVESGHPAKFIKLLEAFHLGSMSSWIVVTNSDVFLWVPWLCWWYRC